MTASDHKSLPKKESENKPVVFLVEGFQSANDPARFPDVAAAIQIASANQCAYFDSVASFDSEHIGERLKNKSENEQKAIVLSIYLAFMDEASTERIVEHLIKKPYQDLVASRVFKEVPNWISNLSVFTMNSFAQQVLSEMFGGDIGKFKEYNKKLREESDRISDQISVKRFLDYVNRNPSVTTVYGLIGKNHLDMLNSIGAVSEKGENYRLIKVMLGQRTVEVHLFGGEHGNMAHYQQLADHVQKKGLTVPPLPKKEDKNVDQALLNVLLKALLAPSAPSRPREAMFESHREERQEKVKTTKELAEQFDFWMKNYNHPIITNNQSLVAWLYEDSGASQVKNYKSFCDLAQKLKSEYKYSTQPPPDEAAYKEAMNEFSRRSAKRRGY